MNPIAASVLSCSLLSLSAFLVRTSGDFASALASGAPLPPAPDPWLPCRPTLPFALLGAPPALPLPFTAPPRPACCPAPAGGLLAPAPGTPCACAKAPPAGGREGIDHGRCGVRSGLALLPAPLLPIWLPLGCDRVAAAPSFSKFRRSPLSAVPARDFPAFFRLESDFDASPRPPRPLPAMPPRLPSWTPKSPAPPDEAALPARGEPVGESENRNASRFSGATFGRVGGDGGGGTLPPTPGTLPPPAWPGGFAPLPCPVEFHPRHQTTWTRARRDGIRHDARRGPARTFRHPSNARDRALFASPSSRHPSNRSPLEGAAVTQKQVGPRGCHAKPAPCEVRPLTNLQPMPNCASSHRRLPLRESSARVYKRRKGIVRLLPGGGAEGAGAKVSDLRAFPAHVAMHVVRVVRDGRDTARSILAMPWPLPDILLTVQGNDGCSV